MGNPDQGFMAAVGTFDGVHRGHAFMLERLRREAAVRGLKTKIITFPDHPLRVIAPDRCPGLLTPADERLTLLTNLGVDEVTILPFDRTMAAMPASEFLEYLRRIEGVDALAMGFNNHIGSDRRSGSSLQPETSGVEIVCLPELDNEAGVSSSCIREALADGDVNRAAKMLGRNYSIEGEVIGGRHLGRRLGFPTANISVADSRQIVPANGVYAVDVTLPDGSVHRGMVNIGHRPTVDESGSSRSIEVNIFNFDGNLYGSTLGMQFIARLRSEQHFDSLEALTAQLHRDREAALNA